MTDENTNRISVIFLTYLHTTLLESKGRMATIQMPYNVPKVPELIVKFDSQGARIFTFILNDF